MIIQLQPEQISAFWPAVKHLLFETHRVNGVNTQRKLNFVLQNLLSGSFQCWLVFESPSDSERVLHAVGITCVSTDLLTGDTFLTLDTVFAFRPLGPEMVRESVNALTAFAITNNCSFITTQTNNPRAETLHCSAGFALDKHTYIMKV